MTNTNKRKIPRPQPTMEEFFLMQNNPFPPPYDDEPEKAQPRQAKEGTPLAFDNKPEAPASETAGQPTVQTTDQATTKEVTQTPVQVKQKIIHSSPLLTRLKSYDDNYHERTVYVDRKTVMIDVSVLNTLARLDLGMTKQNLVNALLTACIEEHQDELKKILKKDTLL